MKATGTKPTEYHQRLAHCPHPGAARAHQRYDRADRGSGRLRGGRWLPKNLQTDHGPLARRVSAALREVGQRASSPPLFGHPEAEVPSSVRIETYSCPVRGVEEHDAPKGLARPAVLVAGVRRLPIHLSSSCRRRSCTRRHVRDHSVLVICVPRSHISSHFAMAAASAFCLSNSTAAAVAPDMAALGAGCAGTAAAALPSRIREAMILICMGGDRPFL